MKYGSLFSGIGGFDLGFDRAGMECAWQCEIDPKAREVLAKHWPNVERFEDVRTIGKHNLSPVDVICGGFPCQDLSVAGKRAGFAGERSSLWFEFARIIDELEPGWVVIENVPGLLSSSRGADFAVLLQWLVKRGYGVCWRVLDAQYFGVAQRRRRVFVVASFRSGRSAEVLFEREGLQRYPPAREKTGQGIIKVAGTLASSGGGMERPAGQGNELDFCVVTGTLDRKSAAANRGQQANEAEFIVPTISCKWAKGTGGHAGDEVQNLISFSAGNSSGSRGIGASENVAPPIRASASGTNQAPTIAWSDQGWQRMDFGDDLSPTMRAYSHGHPPLIGVRRLTPTECARLQGFPDDWNDWLSDSARYKQFGNAVCVNKLEWIGTRLMEALP